MARVGVLSTRLPATRAGALRLFRRLFLRRSPTLTRQAGWRSWRDRGPAVARGLRRVSRAAQKKNWFVYAKPPFAGPEAVLAYLARYTHRVAIANSRLISLDRRGVTFRYKDYRRDGRARVRTMTLAPDEFIRRFLLHVLPRGSTASVTTGCSPAPAARPTSRAPGC